MVRIILMPEEVEQIRKYLIDKSRTLLEQLERKPSKRLLRRLAGVILFLIQAETGARIGEVLNLKKTDFTEVKGRFMVKILKEKKKEGQEKQRFVFLSREASEIVKRYIPFTYEWGENIFPWKGKRKRVFQLAKELGKELFQVFGDPKYLQFHSHVLRASWIYYALSKGIRIDDVQKLVGHEKITTTQRYIEKFYPKIQKNIFEL